MKKPNLLNQVIFFCVLFSTILFNENVSGQLLTANYTFSQFSQPYVPITNGTVHGTAVNDDQLFSNIPMGFFISYNGAQFNSVGISSNGFIWFGITPPLGTNYNPISSTTASTAYICAFARNLESRSTSGGGELRSRLAGTAPHRIFTIQWKNYQRYSSGTANNGDIFNFQIRLFEYNQSIEIVYGAMTTTLNATAQVGMRSTVNTNFMNRVVNATNGWNNSIAGTVNTAAVSYTTTRMPASGQTYRWIPTSLVSNNLSGGDNDTIPNGNPDLLNQNTALTATFVDEGGITSLGIQRFINGVSLPWVAMNKLSGDDTSGVWQVELPNVSVNADVVYLYRIINPSGFFMYSGTIAYEVGYLRVYAPDDMVVPDNAQGSGINLSAGASVSAVKITEVVFDRLAPGGNAGSPSYVPNGDIDLIELTNLSPNAVKLDNLKVEVTSNNTQHQVVFPAGTVLTGGGRVTIQAGGNAGQVNTGVADELYFETGGATNALQSDTPFGIAMFNEQNDVLDAVAFNGYKFSQASGVRVVHWYGDIASSSGKAGARRTTMKDHNTSTDWEFTDGSKIAAPGSMNPGLAAISTSPSFSWSSIDIPGWTPSGSDVQLPVLANGTYNVIVACTDNGNVVDDELTVTVYTPAVPVADFVASEVNVFPNHTVSLTDLSSDYPDTYVWSIVPNTFSFVNGTMSNSASPQLQFTAPGLYSITLNVTNELGSSQMIKNNYVNVMPYLGVCVRPSQIIVSNVTTSSATVSWSEGFFADSMEVRYAKNNGGGNGNQIFTSTFSAALSGLAPATSYNVRVRPWCGGAASGGYTQKKNFTTGSARFAAYNNPSAGLQATVFPNPAIGTFQVKISNTGTNNIRIYIMDLAGKIISEESFATSEGENVINPTALSPGMYIVKVATESEEKVFRVIIL